MRGLIIDYSAHEMIINVPIINAFVGRVFCLSAIGRYFIQLLVLWGHVFCLLSGGRRLSVSQRLKMYCFYGRVNRGHVACPLYRGCPYLGVSVMGGSTVPVSLIHSPGASISKQM